MAKLHVHKKFRSQALTRMASTGESYQQAVSRITKRRSAASCSSPDLGALSNTSDYHWYWPRSNRDDVQGVLEVAREAAEADRRKMGTRDDAGANGAKKGEYESRHCREDQRDAVALLSPRAWSAPPYRALARSIPPWEKKGSASEDSSKKRKPVVVLDAASSMACATVRV